MWPAPLSMRALAKSTLVLPVSTRVLPVLTLVLPLSKCVLPYSACALPKSTCAPPLMRHAGHGRARGGARCPAAAPERRRGVTDDAAAGAGWTQHAQLSCRALLTATMQPPFAAVVFNMVPPR
eukprot:364475-Chlamydomonas_euryale.AAC.11